MGGLLSRISKPVRGVGGAVVAAAVLVGVCSCADSAAKTPMGGVAERRSASTATAPSASRFPAVSAPGLPNAHRVTEKVIAGAQPEGDAAFAALRDMGVKTIISVDGAPPDIAAAEKAGLRYVHLPITYAGVTDAEGKSIAKAISELPGPIYLHCHHGKHRSAAAVAVACVENGSLPTADAEAVLKLFGTGENFKGLWQAAREAKPLPASALAAVKVDYIPVRAIPPLAEAMVEIDERWDRLKAHQKSGWRERGGRIESQAVSDALLLEELFRERGRLDPSRSKQPQFARLMEEAEESARQLRLALSEPTPDLKAVNQAFTRSSQSCTKCHAKFRDE